MTDRTEKNLETDPHIDDYNIYDRGDTVVQWERGGFFSINGAGSIGYPCEKKMSLDSYLPLDTKINSRRFAELNVKGKTVKLLEENIGDQSCDLRVDESVLTGHKKAK